MLVSLFPGTATARTGSYSSIALVSASQPPSPFPVDYVFGHPVEPVFLITFVERAHGKTSHSLNRLRHSQDVRIYCVRPKVPYARPSSCGKTGKEARCAHVVRAHEISSNMVRINSLVRIKDLDAGRRHTGVPSGCRYCGNLQRTGLTRGQSVRTPGKSCRYRCSVRIGVARLLTGCASFGPRRPVATGQTGGYSRGSILVPKTDYRRSLAKPWAFCLHQNVRKHCVEYATNGCYPAPCTTLHPRLNRRNTTMTRNIQFKASCAIVVSALVILQPFPTRRQPQRMQSHTLRWRPS